MLRALDDANVEVPGRRVDRQGLHQGDGDHVDMMFQDGDGGDHGDDDSDDDDGDDDSDVDYVVETTSCFSLKALNPKPSYIEHVLLIR